MLRRREGLGGNALIDLFWVERMAPGPEICRQRSVE
jgi:hypothetical protein